MQLWHKRQSMTVLAGQAAFFSYTAYSAVVPAQRMANSVLIDRRIDGVKNLPDCLVRLGMRL